MKLLTSWWVHAVHLFCCLPLGGSMFFICSFVAYLLVGPCSSSVLLLTSWWVHVLHLFCCLPIGPCSSSVLLLTSWWVHVLHLFCCLPLGPCSSSVFFCVVFIFSLCLVVVCFLLCFLLCFFLNLFFWFCPFFVAPSVFTNVYLREYN